MWAQFARANIVQGTAIGVPPFRPGVNFHSRSASVTSCAHRSSEAFSTLILQPLLCHSPRIEPLRLKEKAGPKTSCGTDNVVSRWTINCCVVLIPNPKGTCALTCPFPTYMVGFQVTTKARSIFDTPQRQFLNHDFTDSGIRNMWVQVKLVF